MLLHFGLPIDEAINKLGRGINPFGGDRFKHLERATVLKRTGKQRYTGCENIDYTGRCQGHKTAEELAN